MLVSVAAISRVQAAGAHVGGADRLDLLDALELVAQKQLIKVCKRYLSGEFSNQKVTSQARTSDQLIEHSQIFLSAQI